MSGWPDEVRPGVPLNPERDGWHWLRNRYGATVPALWVAEDGAWRLHGQDYAAKQAGRTQEYLAPCLTPAEVAARDAARAEVERLRRGWLTTIQTENSCPATGGGCFAKRCGCLAEMEMLLREHDERAASAAKGEA